jgi:hypothetical protein
MYIQTAAGFIPSERTPPVVIVYPQGTQLKDIHTQTVMTLAELRVEGAGSNFTVGIVDDGCPELRQSVYDIFRNCGYYVEHGTPGVPPNVFVERERRFSYVSCFDSAYLPRDVCSPYTNHIFPLGTILTEMLAGDMKPIYTKMERIESRVITKLQEGDFILVSSKAAGWVRDGNSFVIQRASDRYRTIALPTSSAFGSICMQVSRLQKLRYDRCVARYLYLMLYGVDPSGTAMRCFNADNGLLWGAVGELLDIIAFTPDRYHTIEEWVSGAVIGYAMSYNYDSSVLLAFLLGICYISSAYQGVILSVMAKLLTTGSSEIAECVHPLRRQFLRDVVYCPSRPLSLPEITVGAVMNGDDTVLLCSRSTLPNVGFIIDG